MNNRIIIVGGGEHFMLTMARMLADENLEGVILVDRLEQARQEKEMMEKMIIDAKEELNAYIKVPDYSKEKPGKQNEPFYRGLKKYKKY